MKKIFFILMALIVLGACSKDNSSEKEKEQEQEQEGESDFMITNKNVMVLQCNTVTTEGVQDRVEKKFLPYIQIMANEAMESYACQGPDGILSMEPISDSYGQGAQSKILMSQFSSTFPKGTYRVSVKNAKREIAGWSFDIKETEKTLGALKAEISYENGRVKAKWNKVENASFYIVGIGAKGEPYSLIQGKQFINSPESGVDFAISDISAGFAKSEYRLFVRAVQSEFSIVLDSEAILISL